MAYPSSLALVLIVGVLLLVPPCTAGLYDVTYNGYLMEYNEDLSRMAAVYSYNAYSPLESVEAWGQRPDPKLCHKPTTGFTLKEIYHSKKTVNSFAYIGVDSKLKMVIAAFRGTSSLGHVRAAVRNPKRKYTKECILTTPETISLGFVHTGLCQYYQNLESLGFLEGIRSLVLANPDHKLLFAGHSLGGAAASLAATHYGLTFMPKLNGNHPIVYTFGEPRVGDSSFRANFIASGAQGFRVVFRNDIIPRVSFCCQERCKGNEACPYHADYPTTCEGDHCPVEFAKMKCLSDKGCPYHASTQVNYDGGSDMRVGSETSTTTYTVCDPFMGEDDDKCVHPISKKARKWSNLFRTTARVDHSQYWDLLEGLC